MTPGTVDLACALRRRLRRGVSLERAGIAVFEAGFDLPERGLRRSLAALLDGWDPYRMFGVDHDPDADLLDVADQMATVMGTMDPALDRRVTARVSCYLQDIGSDESPEAVAQSVRTNIIRSLEGDQPDGSAAIEMLASLGLMPALEATLVNIGRAGGELRPDEASIGFSYGGVPALRELVASGDLSDLPLARSMVFTMRDGTDPLFASIPFRPATQHLKKLGGVAVMSLILLASG